MSEDGPAVECYEAGDHRYWHRRHGAFHHRTRHALVCHYRQVPVGIQTIGTFSLVFSVRAAVCARLCQVCCSNLLPPPSLVPASPPSLRRVLLFLHHYILTLNIFTIYYFVFGFIGFGCSECPRLCCRRGHGNIARSSIKKLCQSCHLFNGIPLLREPSVRAPTCSIGSRRRLVATTATTSAASTARFAFSSLALLSPHELSLLHTLKMRAINLLDYHIGVAWP